MVGVIIVIGGKLSRIYCFISITLLGTIDSLNFLNIVWLSDKIDLNLGSNNSINNLDFFK